MTKSTKKDKFKQLVETFNTVNLPNKNKELEVRFGTKNKGKKTITKNDFDNVIASLQSMGFICENVLGEYLMRIGYMYINKSGKKIRSNARLELDGHHVVKTYCSKENIKKLLDDDLLKNYIRFVRKDYINVNEEKLKPYDSDDYGFRVSLQTEEILMDNLPFIRSTIDSWDEIEKTYRYIKRFRFTHKDYPLYCDLSIVKSSNFGKSYYILEESGVFKNLENYEIEIEVDNNKLYNLTLENDTNNDVNMIEIKTNMIMESLKKTIKTILQGLQNTKFPISLSEINNIYNEYSEFILKNKNNERVSSLNPTQFIGPGTRTLKQKHIMELQDGMNTKSIRNNYTVTDKADGERCMCYVSSLGKIYLIDSNMRIRFTGSVTKEKKIFNTIIDGELILYNKENQFINLYAAFDIYFVRGKDVRKQPFVNNKIKMQDDKKIIYRHTLLKQFMDIIKPECVSNQHTNAMRFEMKVFEIATEEKNIFKCCDIVLHKTQHESYTYETDGLIFTPALEPLPGINYKHTWDSSFKWKPPKYNTIDFLISYSKKENGDDIEGTIYHDGSSNSRDTGIKKYKQIRLLCGFNQGHKDHGYMNPLEQLIEDKIPDKKINNEYEPVPFYPTNPYDPNASKCNIIMKKDNNGIDQLYTTEGDVIENDTIVEFAYDDLKPSLWKWVPLRVRRDKTYQFKIGIKNYGNAYHVANDNWQSIHNPVTNEMIRMGENIPTELVDDDVYYNRVNGKTNTRSMRDFHNMYVKRLLIKSVSKPGGTLMDFAVGKAGDFPKWISSKLSFIYGIDVSLDNIEHKLDGACSRYLNYKKENNNTPYALFANGDSGELIRNGDALVNPVYKRINKAVFGEGPKDKKILGDGVYRQYGIGKDGFDVTSCQFALHYFFKSPLILKNFLTNVSECTKVGGYFIGTCYDGSSVFNLLKNMSKDESSAIFKNNQKIWEVIKQYDNEEFEDDSTSINCKISVYQESINQPIPEYLVNFNYFERLMSNYGFIVISKEEANQIGLPSGMGMFNELFMHLESEIRNNHIKESNIGKSRYMSEQEKKVSFLNKFFVFKKVRQITKEDLSKELQQEVMEFNENIEDMKKNNKENNNNDDNDDNDDNIEINKEDNNNENNKKTNKNAKKINKRVKLTLKK
tara:strand:- start:2343 stop:5762 length:3420 start_codon:yes stop_codon:yes gene_type:complete